MEGISDIKIIGIDDKRLSIIRPAPYIDLFFKLSHQAPSASNSSDTSDVAENSPQGRLNKIIANLVFDEIEIQ